MPLLKPPPQSLLAPARSVNAPYGIPEHRQEDDLLRRVSDSSQENSYNFDFGMSVRLSLILL